MYYLCNLIYAYAKLHKKLDPITQAKWIMVDHEQQW